MREKGLILFGARLFIWAGMVIGISFLEAPLKFQAPNVTLTIGLGIGRLVFKALNRFEILFIILLWMALLWIPLKSKILIPLGLITLILLIQTFWLLPALDLRALAVIAGEKIQESNMHLYYIALEVLKLISLITLGSLALGEIKQKKNH